MGNNNNVNVPHQPPQPDHPQEPDHPQQQDDPPEPLPDNNPPPPPPPQQERQPQRGRVAPISNLTIGAHATVNINNNQFQFY